MPAARYRRMSKHPARRLKVFQTQIGFYDTVVASSSQAAALRVWGTHQNLFASGEARIATDKSVVAAALQHPGTPLRRALGSNEPFSLEPAGFPKLPDAPEKPTSQRKPPPQPQSAADRSKLNAAETALRELDQRRKREEAGFRRDAEALQARRTAAQEAYVQARKRAHARVLAARESYRKAGGTD